MVTYFQRENISSCSFKEVGTYFLLMTLTIYMKLFSFTDNRIKNPLGGLSCSFL